MGDGGADWLWRGYPDGPVRKLVQLLLVTLWLTLWLPGAGPGYAPARYGTEEEHP